MKDKKYFIKVKNDNLKNLYLLFRSYVFKDFHNQRVLDIIKNQNLQKTNKYAYYFPGFYFKKEYDNSFRFLNEKIDFDLKDPTIYVKRIEWGISQICLILAKKKKVKIYSKSEIQKYVNTKGQL